MAYVSWMTGRSGQFWSAGLPRWVIRTIAIRGISSVCRTAAAARMGRRNSVPSITVGARVLRSSVRHILRYHRRGVKGASID